MSVKYDGTVVVLRKQIDCRSEQWNDKARQLNKQAVCHYTQCSQHITAHSCDCTGGALEHVTEAGGAAEQLRQLQRLGVVEAVVAQQLTVGRHSRAVLATRHDVVWRQCGAAAWCRRRRSHAACTHNTSN